MMDENQIAQLQLDRFESLRQKQQNEGKRLIHQLNHLETGNGYAYEQLIKEIIRYLFESNLQGLREQQIDEDGLNRLDFIARINPNNNPFWHFIVYELNSRYITIECKNYAQEITQGEILTTEKYLYRPALRKCALLFTRKGADKGAIKMLKGAIREQGKLIIVLDDLKVIEMIEAKINNNDPSDYLFDWTDELFYTLSR